MTPEQIEQVLTEHEELWIGSSCYCGCGAVVGEVREVPLVQTIKGAHRAHVAQVLAALVPQATEMVEYGIRIRPGLIAEVSIETETAADYASHGVDIHRRTVTSCAPVVGPWEAVDEPEGGVIRFKPGEVYLDPDDPDEPFKRYSGADS